MCLYGTSTFQAQGAITKSHQDGVKAKQPVGTVNTKATDTKQKEKKMNAAQQLAKKSARARRSKAEARRKRVRELRKQGLSAPKILAILNADGANWKLRTIYEDFKKINQEQENSENATTRENP